MRIKFGLVFYFCALASLLRAQTTLTQVDSGWYDSTGFHSQLNQNYLIGSHSGLGYHDYFIFDLSQLSAGIVTSATLQIFNPSGGYISGNANETFQAGSISLPISTIDGSAFGNVSMYNALSSGTTYGSQNVSSSDNGQWVNVSLNSDFLAAAQTQIGSGIVGLGGYLSGITQSSSETIMFGAGGLLYGSAGGQQPANLILTIEPAPEPSSLQLASIGCLFGLLAFRQSCCRKKV